MENDLKLVKDHIKCSVVKDAFWAKNERGQWYLNNIPIGEGMVDFDKYFSLYKAWDLEGPISIHIPYALFNPKAVANNSERKKAAGPGLVKDLQKTKAYLQKAGIPE